MRSCLSVFLVVGHVFPNYIVSVMVLKVSSAMDARFAS